MIILTYYLQLMNIFQANITLAIHRLKRSTEYIMFNSFKQAKKIIQGNKELFMKTLRKIFDVK